MNGPVHAAASQQAVVGGVNDCVHSEFGDVPVNEMKWYVPYSFPCFIEVWLMYRRSFLQVSYCLETPI